MVGAYGADTFRVWAPSLGTATPNGDGTYSVVLNANKITKYRTLIDRLQLHGVKQIVMMTNPLIPADFPRFVGTDGQYYTTQQVENKEVACDIIRMDDYAWPEPNTEEYQSFLEVQKEYFRLVAQALPGLTHVEGVNEPEHTGATLHKIGWLPDDEISKLDNSGDYVKEQYQYTMSECAQISMDYNYVITQGVGMTDRGIKVLSPALTVLDEAKEFLEKAYQYIHDSKNYFKDTNSDHYFTILNWHPYVFSNVYDGEGAVEDMWDRSHWENGWVALQKSIYQIAVRNGDGDKQVWFTEFGVSDQGSANEAITEAMAATRMQDMCEIVQSKLPFVDTVIAFRLFDKSASSAGAGEANFGMFEEFAQVDSLEKAWKPIGKTFYHILKGQDADENIVIEIVDKYFDIYKGSYEFTQRDNFEDAFVFGNTFVSRSSDMTVSFANGYDYFLSPKLSVVDYNGSKALAVDYQGASSKQDSPRGYISFQFGKILPGTYEVSFNMNGVSLDNIGYWGTTYLGVTKATEACFWLDGVIPNSLTQDGIIMYKDDRAEPQVANTFTFTVTEEIPQVSLTFQISGKCSGNPSAGYTSEGAFRVIFDDISLTKVQ